MVTNRDEWVYDENDDALARKTRYLIDAYNAEVKRQKGDATGELGTVIKWTRAVKADLQKGTLYAFDKAAAIDACYRPYVKRRLYFHSKLNEMQYQLPSIFGSGGVKNRCIVLTDSTAQKPWMTCAVEQVPDLHFVGAAAGSVCIPLQRLAPDGSLSDNITDWALKQFTAHYKAAEPLTPALSQREENKEDPARPTSFTTAMPCCTTRCTARSTRKTSSASSRAHPVLPRLLALGRMGRAAHAAAHRLRSCGAVCPHP